MKHMKDRNLWIWDVHGCSGLSFGEPLTQRIESWLGHMSSLQESDNIIIYIYIYIYIYIHLYNQIIGYKPLYK